MKQRIPRGELIALFTASFLLAVVAGYFLHQLADLYL